MGVLSGGGGGGAIVCVAPVKTIGSDDESVYYIVWMIERPSTLSFPGQYV